MALQQVAVPACGVDAIQESVVVADGVLQPALQRRACGRLWGTRMAQQRVFQRLQQVWGPWYVQGLKVQGVQGLPCTGLPQLQPLHNTTQEDAMAVLCCMRRLACCSTANCQP